MPTSTKWGTAQQSKKIARGIIEYSTASHGGLHVSPERQAKMPEMFRLDDGWYEEDCDYMLVVLSFPSLFPAHIIEAAHGSVKSWHPNRYEAWRRVTEPGYEIPLEESYKKRQNKFRQDNQNNMVVVSASDSQYPDMLACQTTRGGGFGRVDDDTTAQYLVPKQEYAQRGEFGFVIDPARHKLLSSTGW